MEDKNPIGSLLRFKKARESSGSSGVDQENEINSGNEVMKDQLHPLLVDVVLENMLSYVDMKSFKMANLVCKPWFNALRKVMAKKLIFQFNEDSAFEFLKENDGSTLPMLITPNVNTGISSIRLRFSLERSDCDGFLEDKTAVNRISYATASALLERFMAMPSTQIIELDVDICSKNPMLQFWKMVSSLSLTLEKLTIHTNCTCCGCYVEIVTALPIAQIVLPHENDHDNNDLSEFSNEVVTFPNLKVVSGEFRKFGRSNKIPEFLQKILTHSPNLEGLHCDMVLSNDHVMFDVLKSKPNAFHALNSLSFVAMNNEEFQILLGKELKLKSLSVALHSGFRVLAFYKFLSSQGKTLESLAVDFVCLPNKVPETFFCAKDLTKLKHLTMSRFYGSIHFVSLMPNLETLVLRHINLSVALRDEAANFNYTSKLKSLQIFGGRGSTGRFLMPAVYYDIVSFFPELKQLRMEYFTDTTLRIILEGLPYLEELDIPNGIYSDEVLIGGFTVLNTNGERRRKEDDLVENKPACFSNPKKLRKVVLQSPKITDAGIMNGLVHCRELRSISIDSPMVSDVSLKALSQIPEIRHLEFLNCFQLTPAAISEAKALWGESRLLVIKN